MSTRQEIGVLRAISELLDCVEAQLFWIIQFAKEHNVPQARLESLNHLVTRTRVIFRELQTIDAQSTMSDAILQGKRSDEDFTEPPRKFYIDDILPVVTKW
jgi:hypothetical protein